MKETQETPIEDLKDEEINLLEYIYDEKDTVEIPAKMLEGLIQLLGQVEQNETSHGFISNYPKNHSFVEKDGIVESITVEWEQHPTANSYFTQEPQETKSMLGVMALDLNMLLKQEHLQNIRSGKAKKIGTLKKVEDDGIKLN